MNCVASELYSGFICTAATSCLQIASFETKARLITLLQNLLFLKAGKFLRGMTHG